MLLPTENPTTNEERFDNTFSIGRTEENEIIKLKKRALELEQAIQTVLRYIGSHQVYDKDARGILLRALNK